MNMRSLFRISCPLLLALILLVSFLCACSGVEATPDPSTDPGAESSAASELTIAISDAKTLDPITSDRTLDLALCSLLYESLYTIDEDMTLRPCLAVSCDLVSGGLAVTISGEHTFWDGTSVTAKDVKYSFDRIRQASYSSFDAALSRFGTATVQSDLRILFSPADGRTLCEHDASALIFPILSASANDREPMGSGPYRLDGKAGDRYLTARSDDLPVQEISLRVESTLDGMVKDFENGSLDLFCVDPLSVDDFHPVCDHQISGAPSGRALVLLCRSSVSFDEISSLSQVIDRRYICTDLLGSDVLPSAEFWAGRAYANIKNVPSASPVYDDAIFGSLSLAYETGLWKVGAIASCVGRNFHSVVDDFTVEGLSKNDFAKSLNKKNHSIYLCIKDLTDTSSLYALLSEKNAPIHLSQDVLSANEDVFHAPEELRPDAEETLAHALSEEPPFIVIGYELTRTYFRSGIMSDLSCYYRAPYGDPMKWSVAD